MLPDHFGVRKDGLERALVVRPDGRPLVVIDSRVPAGLLPHVIERRKDAPSRIFLLGHDGIHVHAGDGFAQPQLIQVGKAENEGN